MKVTTKSDDYSQFDDENEKDESKELYESYSISDEKKNNTMNTGSVFPDSLFQPYEVQLKATQKSMAKKEKMDFDQKKKSDAVVSNTFDRASSKTNSVLKREMNKMDIN